MTIVQKDWNIHKNADGLSTWTLPNNIDNTASVAEEAPQQIPIEGISVTDLNTTFFEEVRNSYTQDNSCSIICRLLTKDFKDHSLIHALEEVWNKSYNEGIFHLLDGIIYHRTKPTYVMTVVDRSLINLVMKECHDSQFSGHLSKDRTREKSRHVFGGQCGRRMLQSIARPVTDVKKQTNTLAKSLGNMIKIQEPSRTWEIVHMDWVTGLPPWGYISYNAFLVIVERFRKTPIFLPCHKDDTAMDTALLIWNRVVSWTGIFTNIISSRDPRFTSALWKKLNQLFGAKFSFFTAYHPQTDGLEYKTSIHSSTNQTPAVLQKGCNPRLAQDLVKLNPTASSFKGMIDKATKHSVRCMEDSFAFYKDKWDKSHATPDFKVGDLALHGENAVKVELSEELSNKHPTLPVSLIKPYKSSDAEKFPLRKNVSHNIPPVKSPRTKKITKVLKERKLRTKKVREYLVRYSDPTCEDEWLAENNKPEATKLLR
ncbi:hypothetical protein O181_091931 [Austropuccinia psidii MF-1]|uniref:Integrase catalytic domain-containing protein n=1 Tax=Austropuccinia psidii MF-1 TaxID=1389203 RepID=A0A9Q3PA45_9BASI|nr:hypothetical protein [Austropuccinia psidii MF-1]